MEHITRLEAAMVAVTRHAYDARGLLVHLCNPMDVDDVRAKILYYAASLQVGNQHLVLADGHYGYWVPDKHAESNTARNLALLAELLSAHLEYEHERRVNPDECKHQTS